MKFVGCVNSTMKIWCCLDTKNMFGQQFVFGWNRLKLPVRSLVFGSPVHPNTAFFSESIHLIKTHLLLTEMLIFNIYLVEKR